MKIVMLERDNVGTDIDLSKFESLGELAVYGKTRPEEMEERIKDADIVVLNKLPMNKNTMKGADKIKLLCVTATGTDNVDSAYCESMGIKVKNVKGYSTETVVQHTFSLLFYLLEHMRFYDDYVKEGGYEQSPIFTYFGNTFHDLNGMRWGIVGLGDIGKRVYDVAKTFGARPFYYSTSGLHNEDGYERADWETLLSESDIISIHAPLNNATRGLFDEAAFRRMKKTAYLINAGRGPIIVEKDLVWALKNGEIAGAGLDVLSREPIRKENPLNEIKDPDRLVITPHIAWASVEARQRLMDGVYENIAEFIKQETGKSF